MPERALSPSFAYPLIDCKITQASFHSLLFFKKPVFGRALAWAGPCATVCTHSLCAIQRGEPKTLSPRL